MKEGKRVWNWLLFFVCAAVLTVGLVTQAACARSVFAPPAVSCAGDNGTEKTLIPVGRTVGIKLFSKGVMVVALSEIQTTEGRVWPAKQCGLQEGDIITEIENQPVNSIDEVARAVRKNGGHAMAIQALRDGRQMEVTAEAVPCMADGSYKLGAWLRDSMAGIGTVTYYDPDNQVFAALGHGINDIDTGLLVPIRSGGIMSSSVSAVIKGQKSQPGQLHGTFDLTHDIGTLSANSDCGVLGSAQPEVFPGEAVPVAKRSAVRTGAAVIRCNVDGEQVEEYSVEILRIYPELGDHTRNLLLQVNDKRLLEQTGGIVQGMSGSPILQDGKLVGAVTHVLLNDPTRGYGIFVENMLDAVS